MSAPGSTFLTRLFLRSDPAKLPGSIFKLPILSLFPAGIPVFQVGIGDSRAIPNNHDVFAIISGGRESVIERAGLNRRTINDNIFIVMNGISIDRARRYARLHQQIKRRPAFTGAVLFDVILGIDQYGHLDAPALRRDEMLNNIRRSKTITGQPDRRLGRINGPCHQTYRAAFGRKPGLRETAWRSSRGC